MATLGRSSDTAALDEDRERLRAVEVELDRCWDLLRQPECLWQALTDPAFTERYWGVAFESDWNAGSTLTLRQWGLTIADPEQVVLESDPYRRLSYTWHTFTPEWREIARERVGFTEEFLARVAAEQRSKATFEIEDLGELVKLTVIHDGFEAGSEVLETISEGWPQILSNLKTLLETGETLPDSAAADVSAAASSS